MLSDFEVKYEELVQEYLKRIGISEQESIGEQVLFVRDGDDYYYYYRIENDEYPVVQIPLGERFRDTLLSLKQMYRGVREHIDEMDDDGVSDLEYEKCAHIYFGYELEKMIALANKYVKTGRTIGSMPFSYMREELTRPLIGKPREVTIKPELWEMDDDLRPHLPKYQSVRNAICLNAEVFSKKAGSIPKKLSEHQIKAFHIENDVQLMEVILSLLDDFDMKLGKCKLCKEIYISPTARESEYCTGCEEWKDYKATNNPDPAQDKNVKKVYDPEKEAQSQAKKNALNRTRRLFRSKQGGDEKFDISLLYLDDETNAMFGQIFRTAIEYPNVLYKDFSDTLAALVNWEEEHNENYSEWLNKLGRVRK